MARLLKILPALLLTNCTVFTSGPKKPDYTHPTVATTPLKSELRKLPKLDGPKIFVAVNSFKDLTGKRKSTDNFASFSSAVTQGAEAWLIESLMASDDWFNVLERTEQESLIRERTLVNQSRLTFDEKPTPLAPLKYAGILAFGGIIDYDTNNITGGAGASYLGIGASEEYRQDTVTVSLRFVSTSSGEVLVSTTVTKTIISTALSATSFKFVDIETKPVEAELGFAKNELVSAAVRSAIDKAIIDLIYQGEQKKLWAFKKK